MISRSQMNRQLYMGGGITQLSMNEIITIKAKDKHRALGEVREILLYKFYNQLDGLEAKER